MTRNTLRDTSLTMLCMNSMSLAASNAPSMIIQEHLLWLFTDANASYNELRVWNKAMTEEELMASAIAGPDAEL